MVLVDAVKEVFEKIKPIEQIALSRCRIAGVATRVSDPFDGEGTTTLTQGGWLARGGRPEVDELGLVATEVSARANSVANDDASVAEPTPPRGQLRLL